MSDSLSAGTDHGLPAEWRWYTLGEIAKVVGGGTPDTKNSDFWRNGSVPWVTPADLTGYSMMRISEGARAITVAGLEASGAKLMPAGTVLLSSRAPVGYVAIAGAELCTNQGFKSLVLRDDSVMPEFLYWYLKANVDLVRTFASGTTFPEVSGKRVATIPIPVPPLELQRRIVQALDEQLSELDAAATCLSRSSANNERLRNSILRAVLIARNVELPATIGPEHFRWPVVPLRDVASVQGGIQKQPTRAPRNNHYPFLRVANVFRGRLALEDVHEIELFGDELARLRLNRGDLLIVEGNGSPNEVGRMAVWDGSISDCVHQNHLIRVRPGDLLIPEFLELVWNSPAGKDAVRAVASSTSGLHTLNISKISSIMVPLPPVAEQREVVSRATAMFSELDRLAIEIDSQRVRCHRLRQSILKAAFEGRLVPQTAALEQTISPQTDAEPPRSRQHSPSKFRPRKPAFISAR